MSKAAELAALIGSQSALSNRNLVINGAMQVAQRGTDINSLGETGYSTDRFRTRTYGGDGRFDYDQVTDVVPSSTFKYAAKYTVSTAATDVGSFGYSVQQVIEGHNIAQLRIGRSDAKPFTISFWARSSVSGTYSSGVTTNAGDISFVTEFTLVANTWKYISYTVPAYTTSVPTNLNETNSNGLFFTVIGLASQTSKQTSTLDAWQSGNFAFSSNQTNFMSATSRTVHITGVQLEVGEQATPFEHRSYGDELAACQRYYYRIASDQYAYFATGRVINTSDPLCAITFPTAMRTTPSVTSSNTAAWYNNAGSIVGVVNPSVHYSSGENNINTLDVKFQASGTLASNNSPMMYAFNPAGYIDFDSEL